MNLLYVNDLAWVSLGGNLGDVEGAFNEALLQVLTVSKSPILPSPRYWSEPWGKPGQPRFLNQVFGFKPAMDPELMMEFLHHVEARQGRDRSKETRWGPRTLDLDLLCWPDVSGRLGDLELPHPRLHLRRFVLQPWADVAPNLIPCGLTETIETLLRQCTDTAHIERCQDY